MNGTNPCSADHRAGRTKRPSVRAPRQHGSSRRTRRSAQQHVTARTDSPDAQPPAAWMRRQPATPRKSQACAHDPGMDAGGRAPLLAARRAAHEWNRPMVGRPQGRPHDAAVGESPSQHGSSRRRRRSAPQHVTARTDSPDAQPQPHGCGASPPPPGSPRHARTTPAWMPAEEHHSLRPGGPHMNGTDPWSADHSAGRTMRPSVRAPKQHGSSRRRRRSARQHVTARTDSPDAQPPAAWMRRQPATPRKSQACRARPRHGCRRKSTTPLRPGGPHMNGTNPCPADHSGRPHEAAVCESAQPTRVEPQEAAVGATTRHSAH